MQHQAACWGALRRLTKASRRAPEQAVGRSVNIGAFLAQGICGCAALLMVNTGSVYHGWGALAIPRDVAFLGPHGAVACAVVDQANLPTSRISKQSAASSTQQQTLPFYSGGPPQPPWPATSLVYITVNIRIYEDGCPGVHMHNCTCVCTHIHIDTNRQNSSHVHMYACVCMCVKVHGCSDLRMCAHVYMYIC